jgi:hypothetical protein
MEITVTQTVTIPEMYGTPAEVGKHMLADALRVWYQYDEMSNFKHEHGHGIGIAFYDPNFMTKPRPIGFEAFFRKHVELIWLGTIDNYRHDWIGFAFKSAGADPEDYDDNTVDAVLQNMLYGEVVYG